MTGTGAASPSTETLPATGAPMGPLAVGALGLIGLGAALIVAELHRARRTT